MKIQSIILVCIVVGIILGVFLFERESEKDVEADDVPSSTPADVTTTPPADVTTTPPTTPPADVTTPPATIPPPTTDSTTALIPAEDLTITVIYDNNPYDPNLDIGWGFSCLIEGAEKTILFDTGRDGTLLLKNMEKLGIDSGEVDVIILSHIHGDHTDGLPAVLRKNSDVTVYVLQSFPYQFKETVRGYGAEVVEVSEPIKICENAYSTGEMGPRIKEQSLAIRTDKGLIVITGCAHPGISRIVRKVKYLFKDDILFVMGGFHLADKNRSELEVIISDFRELGVLYVAPCHCSGSLAQELFKQEYDQNYIEIGVGKVIYVKDLE